jgi:N-acetylated-alpha-linked acidic dipeptidase
VQQSLDDALRNVEHGMLSEAGLPRRPWFKHQIYAPGFYTGYGVKTLPGVREAVEEHHWTEAAEQIVVVSNAIERSAVLIDRAAAIAKGN